MRTRQIKPAVTSTALLLGMAGLLTACAVKKPAPLGKEVVDHLNYPKLNPIQMSAVTRETLPNGIKLILIEDHELPVISMRAVVKGGKLAQPQDKPALAGLFGEVQRTGGVKSMSGDEMDTFLERIGASIETNVRDDFGTVTAKTLTEQLDKVLPLFAEVLESPAFAQEKIDLAKTHLNSEISRRNDQVMGIARREFLKLVYGERSPYARQFEYDDVAAVTRRDLVDYHKLVYRPDSTIIAVWGDFNSGDMKDKLEIAFGGWESQGPTPTYKAPALPSPAPSVNYAEKKDVEQTTVLMGHLGLRYDDPDFPAINVLSEILGGGMASRMFMNIRTLKGLAYGAGGFMVPAYDHLGAFYFYTATKPSTTTEAIKAMLEEINKIREAPVSDEELSRAKEGYLNTYAFEFDSTEKIATRLATYDLYGYPADFNARLRDAIEKVTKEDVLRVAKKDLHPELLTVLAIGNQAQFDKPLSTFGQVKNVDLTIPEPKPKEVIPEATPESIKAGTALLTNAAKAMGDKALAGLKDLALEGASTVTTPMGEMELKGNAVFVLPNRLHNQIQTPMGSMTTVLDKDKGFMTMGPRVKDLPPSAVNEMAQELYTECGCALLMQQALQRKVEGQLIGKAQFEGQEADDVLVKVGDASLRLYIDGNGQIKGVRKHAVTQEGPAEVIQIFSDYRPVSGLNVPFEAVEKVNGEVKAANKYTSITVNAGFSEDLFKRPEAPAGPATKP